MKKIASLALVLITILSLAVPTFATDGDSNRKVVYEKGVLLTPNNNTGVSGIAPPAYDPINDQINAEKESRLPLPTLSSASVNITRAPTSYTISCVARKQITNAWCGLANVEQVLKATNAGGHHMPTYHSTSAYNGTNQGGLAYVYGISPTSGTEPSQLTPMLNNYTNSKRIV